MVSRRLSCGRLRCRRRCSRWSATSVCAYHVLSRDRPLRAQVDATGRRSRPVGLAQKVKGLGKPATVVLVLEHSRPVAAAANDQPAAHDCNTETGSKVLQNRCPGSLICLSVKTHFASAPWQTASYGFQRVTCKIGHWLVRSLADRSLADRSLADRSLADRSLAGPSLAYSRSRLFRPT